MTSEQRHSIAAVNMSVVLCNSGHSATVTANGPSTLPASASASALAAAASSLPSPPSIASGGHAANDNNNNDNISDDSNPVTIYRYCCCNRRIIICIVALRQTSIWSLVQSNYVMWSRILYGYDRSIVAYIAHLHAHILHPI